MAAAVTPDKKFLLVLNGGYNPPSISVIDIATNKAVGRAAVPDGWLGLVIDESRRQGLRGRRIAGGDLRILAGERRPDAFAHVPDRGRERPQAGGFHRRHSVLARWPPALRRRPLSRFGGRGESPIRARGFPHQDRPAAVSASCSIPPARASMFRAGRTVRSASTTRATGAPIATVRVAPHTTDMVWREGSVEEHPEITARLFVSASNTNNVYVLGANGIGRAFAL